MILLHEITTRYHGLHLYIKGALDCFRNSEIQHLVAFGVSFNLILQSESNWSLFNGTWPKKSKLLYDRLRFEVGGLTLQMHRAVH